MTTFERLLDIKAKRGAGYIVLIDPDKQKIEKSIEIAQQAETEGVDAIFIGGSLLFYSTFEEFVEQIKTHVSIPVILFPGSTQQISRHADAILFLSVLSGRNPETLIGQQVKGAPLIKMYNLEAISTAYMLVESGVVTSAEFMSNTRPLPREKNDIAVAHALAAEYLGMKLIYLEAGSGAKYPVPDEMIDAVSRYAAPPLIVGGGIRTPEIAAQKVKAGASFIVTGNVLENAVKPGHIAEFADAIHNVVSQT
ncbi:geranylgeranylglyceryl/heptaprenylglyceryl phosphate synthase [candidate division KSB1 bacterium]|nr:geranylgeranylglyceryl/heptaprenylglyceryl phosphate synthase [candidate division KSB1 bacterium]